MEENNHSNSLRHWLSDPVLWIGLLSAVYLAVLPMAGTIALRNAALLMLLICLAWQLQRVRGELRYSLPILLWVVYLIVFPLLSTDHSSAWQNFSGQWGRGILAMLVGAGVAVILAPRLRDGVFYLGVISAIPILIHLVLIAWKTWETGAIPWGSWGRETHHADLGYAAGQTVVLMAATIVAADRKFRSWAITLIIAALLSTVLARSRAGLAFAIFGGLLVFIPGYLVQITQYRRHVLLGMTFMMLAVAGLVGLAIKEDPRWSHMKNQLSAGFLGNPIQIECEGTSSIEAAVIDKYGVGDRAQVLLTSIQGGDGARMVLMRAGLELALKHPLGSDGSRHSFQRLLRQECPNPAITMAHTHNGWLDTMLALGWVGAGLYLLVLLYFFRQGYLHLRGQAGLNEWALVLVALSAFWIVRGFTDSVFRDHMLEMQGFVLTYAVVMLHMQAKSRKMAFSGASEATP